MKLKLTMEVTTGSVERYGEKTTLQEDMIQDPNDVVLYYRHDGSLLHSGIVTHVDGDGIRTANKLGIGAEISGTICGIGWIYELDGAYDQDSNIGGGRIVVYRIDSEKIDQLVPVP